MRPTVHAYLKDREINMQGKLAGNTALNTMGINEKCGIMLTTLYLQRRW